MPAKKISGSINSRICRDLESIEHQFLQARLTSGGEAILEYLHPKAMFVSPNEGLIHDTSTPKLFSYLKSPMFQTWSTFELVGEMHVQELAMMAGTVSYHINAAKVDLVNGQVMGPVKTFRMYCSSSWKQEASGDWKLMVHHQSPY